MSEQNPSSSSAGSATGPQHATPKRRRFVTGMVAGGVLGGLLATAFTAWSSTQGPGGWHGGGGWCRTSMSPEAQRERAEFATDWMLNKVNATDAQRTQVKAIVAQAMQELMPA